MTQDVRLTFLGTGDKCGIPKIGCECATCQYALRKRDHTWRTRSAIVLTIGEHHIFIDAGPDLREQMINNNIKNVDSVWLTHPHYDHVSGLQEFYRVVKDFDLFAIAPALKYVSHQLGLAFMKYHPHELVPYTSKNHLGVTFTPFLVNHRMWNGMQAIGLAIEWNNFKLVITGDTTRDLPMRTIETMQEPDILIADVFADEFFFDGLPHMVLDEAVDLSEKINAKTVYFTHCSHRTPPHHIFQSKVHAINPKYNVAYDGLTLAMPPLSG
ncbi:MAG: MBL fold metallo-hydrolase [Candidatus Ranarchaeia archaeon]